MKFKEITITVSRTFNLGQFESLRVEAGMCASIEDGDLEDVREKLLIEVRRSLKRTYEANLPENRNANPA